MQVFENAYMSAWMEDEIFIGVFKKNLIIGLEVAKETTRLRKEVTQNKKVRGILYISNVKAISSKAKKYYANESMENVEKFALISGSLFTTMLGNAFLKLVPPKIPCKVFSKKEEALKWLKR